MNPGVLIEGLVIVLLCATIAYCYVLSGKLKSLKLEENALRATIAELLTTTELADRAIRGLKASAQENQKTLGVHIKQAERLNVELASHLGEGAELMSRLVAITKAGSGGAYSGVNTGVIAEPRRPISRPTVSQPRAVSELAAEAAARISALRNSGGA